MTLTPLPAAFVMPSRYLASGIRLVNGLTAPLPPPPMLAGTTPSGDEAFGPTTTIVFTFARSSGRVSRSFFKSTIASSAMASAVLADAGESMGRSGFTGFQPASSQPCAKKVRRMRCTALSTFVTETVPLVMAAWIFARLRLMPLGISRSRPRVTSVVACEAPQSDITRPLNPHSFFST